MYGVKIALTGRMRSGKDVIAAYLIEKHGFKRFAFGDGVRSVARMLYPDKGSNGSKPRSLYQEIGQALREADPEVWVRYLLREIAEKTGPQDSIVISDLRQPNEYAALINAGFTIVRVTASYQNRMARMKALGDVFRSEDVNHETESYIDQYVVDFEITNNGTLDRLSEKMEIVLSNI
ncbi:AAA family ATPase [Heliophilum fasciatum]|uniref:Dephospho-CoA kinase n=1 Tax=Heliophilum fasciatum TaxID=35700 RepID=A0A4R2RD95_9FIRM|nr:AAA family ATPase [Heliophilum fasciatum]MCW2279293.1 dephospho-CoA kinase [Heliophilum fasciatum]TCP60454.1 hypothetical protein EDD73_13714 [Heliophilum fasciatum]